MLRSPISSIVKSAVSGGLSGDTPTLATIALLDIGVAPTIYLNFMTNRALWMGSDIGPISAIPSLSGTPQLSASGNLVDGSGGTLQIPLSGIAYPLSLIIEAVRTVDTGGVEDVVGINDGATTNQTVYQINAGDQYRFNVNSGGVGQAAIGGGSVALEEIRRIAGRVATNSAQAARTPTANLGTEDTTVTLPANPTQMSIGLSPTSVRTFTGYIRMIAIVASAMSDAELQAAVT